MGSRPVPEGIRITKVGLWYILITLVVAVAATNTGNNALYMVWAVMLAVLVVSGFVSRQNVRHLAVRLEVPDEIFANRPFTVRFTLNNRGRLWARWFLIFSVTTAGKPYLLPYLPRRGKGRGELEMSLPKRGWYEFRAVHVASLFPFGLFRKGTRYPVGMKSLVYPEIFPAATSGPEQQGELGHLAVRRPGWGHDLHALRGFRSGDDPRGIHWKQSARTGNLIYMVREAEETRRLSILLDNGVGELSDEAIRRRFERLVSEAATAAIDYLGRGHEVELVARNRTVPFGGGARQRLVLLEALALLEEAPAGAAPLVGSDLHAPQLRLALEGPRGEAGRADALPEQIREAPGPAPEVAAR